MTGGGDRAVHLNTLHRGVDSDRLFKNNVTSKRGEVLAKRGLNLFESKTYQCTISKSLTYRHGLFVFNKVDYSNNNDQRAHNFDISN